MIINHVHKGFTLVELAVSLVIIGTLLGAGVKFYAAQAERSAYELTKQRQETIKNALTAYIGKFSRLPCPDQNLAPDGRDDADRTAGSCTRYVGTVPYNDLGLDRDVVLDGWDNYMVYALSPGWERSYTTSASPSQYQTNVATDAFWPGHASGSITIQDRIPATNPTTTNTSGIAAAILSYGRNGAGALNVSNNTNALPPSSTDEESNALLTASPPVIYKRDYTEQDIATYGAFDDVVLAISPDDFISPLTISGALRDVGPASVMDGAYDYVVGEIIKTKTICILTCIGYYYIVPGAITFPAGKLQGWGSTYTSSGGIIHATGGAFTNFTIDVDGADAKTVSSSELRAVLAKRAGFN